VTDHNVDWATCADDGCNGIRLPTGDKCWAHAAEADLDPALKRLGEDGRLDARGVPITQELLERLLASAPQDDHGHTLLMGALLDRATFRGDAVFLGAIFKGDASFDRAVFQGDALFHVVTFQWMAVFREATFRGDAMFRGATFQSDARFERATFQGEAWFDRATFQGAADFTRATFQDIARFGYDGATFQAIAVFRKTTFKGDAGFDMVTFQGNAWFDRAVFQGDALFHVVTFQWMAVFREATFHRYVGFRAATFQSDAQFAGAIFQGYALFDKATFQQARQLGPMLVRKSLLLRQAVFHQRAQIEIAAAAVCCQQARFPAGVQLRVRWAQIVLDDADLAAPSILTGASTFQEVEEGRWARALARLEPAGARASRPRLLSVRRGDVAGLTVAGVDLRACRFAGAHRLDQLRIEESIFASTPTGWRWTTRQTIAEEHHWRAASSHPDEHDRVPGTASPSMAARGAGWYHSAHWPPAWLDVQPPTPAQTAALYRALRKGREDSKDEPGAADFYYGEMEMRRHDSTKPMGERFVLFLYWLFSGYALRASRALVWLFAVLAVATLLLAAQGLEQPAAGWSFPARLGTAALVAVEGAVFRASEQQLTYVGRLIQAALRFAGPILLGLAVLSIRGRVKR
jgi:uncharacterized protein YjbI with pentapeptide repeats